MIRVLVEKVFLKEIYQLELFLSMKMKIITLF